MEEVSGPCREQKLVENSNANRNYYTFSYSRHGLEVEDWKTSGQLSSSWHFAPETAAAPPQVLPALVVAAIMELKVCSCFAYKVLLDIYTPLSTLVPNSFFNEMRKMTSNHCYKCITNTAHTLYSKQGYGRSKISWSIIYDLVWWFNLVDKSTSAVLTEKQSKHIFNLVLSNITAFN